MKFANLFLIVVLALTYLSCDEQHKRSQESDSPSESNIPASEQEAITTGTREFKDFSMFPKADPGYTRYVIRVPKIKDEYYHQLEVIVGKQMKIDCNLHSLTGELEEISIPGWGYSYYKYPEKTDVISTSRGCPDNKMRDAFVQGAPKKTYYNSAMPTVVYVPKDLEVKYAIWSRQNKQLSAEVLP